MVCEPRRQQPTARRPTKTKRGPNNASGIVWAPFTGQHHHQGSTKANAGSRMPTAANAGRRRPTAATDGQKRPTQAPEDEKGPKRCVWHCLGPRYFFFFYFFVF